MSSAWTDQDLTDVRTAIRSYTKNGATQSFTIGSRTVSRHVADMLRELRSLESEIVRALVSPSEGPAESVVVFD